LFEGVRQFETRWIGWAGVNVTDETDQIALTKALEEQVCGYFILLCQWNTFILISELHTHIYQANLIYYKDIVVHILSTAEVETPIYNYGFKICMFVLSPEKLV
jgi:hypothetical protein